MDMNLKLEYIILIILALMFYFYSLKDDINRKKNKKFIDNNLSEGSKIVTKSGIIGEVTKIDDSYVIIATGTLDSITYLKVEKDSIKSILDM